MNNIIIVKDTIDFECNSIKELVKFVFGENYYDLNDKEKEKLRDFNAYKECVRSGVDILNKKEDITMKSVKEKFVILDEMTYIISLLKFSNTVIMEKKGADIISKYMNKNNITKNYIVLNKFADELMENYIKEIYG